MTEQSTIPFRGLRGAIARNMTLGWQAPRVAMNIEVNMEACKTLQAELQTSLGSAPRLTPTPLILKALALTLKEHPGLNALVDDKGVTLCSDINIGLAVSVEGGLTVPVIRSADEKSIVEIAEESRELALASRSGNLAAKSYQGGTFTVSNLGMTGIDWFTPIINPPQIAIIGISSVLEKVVAKAGEIVIVPIMNLTLVFDHRAIDGYPAAKFLAALRSRLEHPVDL